MDWLTSRLAEAQKQAQEGLALAQRQAAEAAERAKALAAQAQEQALVIAAQAQAQAKVGHEAVASRPGQPAQQELLYAHSTPTPVHRPLRLWRPRRRSPSCSSWPPQQPRRPACVRIPGPQLARAFQSHSSYGVCANSCCLYCCFCCCYGP